MGAFNNRKQWDYETDFFLLQAIEMGGKFKYTYSRIAEHLHMFLGRTEKAVELRLSELGKPSNYEPKVREKKQQATQDTVDVIVTVVKPYGAFCVTSDGKTTGLLHISRIANHFISNLENYLSPGDKLKVKMIKRDDGKVDFDIRSISPLPPKVLA